MAPEPEDDIMNEKNPRPLDEDDIALLKTYVRAATLLLDLSDLLDLRVLLSVWSWVGASELCWVEFGLEIGIGF